jgi:hypothetical protein
MFIDLRVNEATMGSISRSTGIPELRIEVQGQYPLEKVEILRNSEVIHTFDIYDNTLEFEKVFRDPEYKEESEVLYYYLRATQKNKALAWSSPVWVDRT